MSIRHSQLMLDTKNIHICKPNKIPISNSEYGLTLEYTTERERERMLLSPLLKMGELQYT